MTEYRKAVRICLATMLLCFSFEPQIASADQPITQQAFADLFDLKRHHELGYTGAGVTIAYIEAAPELSAPELAGANIEVKPGCDLAHTPKEIAHSTAVASILSNREWGWVPEAKIVNYTIHYDDKKAIDEAIESKKCELSNFSLENQINRALNDGADIINVSGGHLATESLAPTYARAALMGVPIIAAAGNTAEFASYGIGEYNTVIAVGATDMNGIASEFSSRGKFLTIMAPGEEITVRKPSSNGKLSEVGTTAGTSYAAPMVTGLVAMGMDRWENATGNQIIHSLIKSSNDSGAGWTEDYGFGIISITDFLNMDPAAFEDKNPLWDKGGDWPSEQMAADYSDGLVTPSSVPGDTSYIYRGTNERIVADNPEISQIGTSPRYHE